MWILLLGAIRYHFWSAHIKIIFLIYYWLIFLMIYYLHTWWQLMKFVKYVKSLIIWQSWKKNVTVPGGARTRVLWHTSFQPWPLHYRATVTIVRNNFTIISCFSQLKVEISDCIIQGQSSTYIILLPQNCFLNLALFAFSFVMPACFYFTEPLR